MSTLSELLGKKETKKTSYKAIATKKLVIDGVEVEGQVIAPYDVRPQPQMRVKSRKVLSYQEICAAKDQQPKKKIQSSVLAKLLEKEEK